MRISDWSSDVCSSDLAKARPRQGDAGQADTFPGVWRPRENAARDPPCFLGMPNAQFATRDGQQQMGRKSRALRTQQALQVVGLAVLHKRPVALELLLQTTDRKRDV